MNSDDYVAYLTEQANRAIRAGANPAKVEQIMLQQMQNAGLQPEAASQPKVDKETKTAYRNMVVPSVVQDMNRVNYSPDQEYWNDVMAADERIAARNDAATQQEREQTQKSASQIFKDSAKAATASTAQGLLRSIPTDWAQNAADDLKEYTARKGYSPTEDANAGAGRRVASIGGGILGTLAPMAVSPVAGTSLMAIGQGGAAAERAMDAGATPEQAWAYGTAAGAAFPILSKVAPAFGNSALAKTLTGAGLNTGVGVGQRTAMNQIAPERLKEDVFDPWALATDAAMGGVLGRFSPSKKGTVPKAEEAPITPTGDPAVDAGAQAYKNIGKQDRIPDFVEQTDLFTKNNEGQVQGDLFNGDAVTGSTAESRRRYAQDNPLERTLERQAELERDYIFDQQERVTNPPNEGIVSRKAEMPEAYKQIAQAELPYERPPLITTNDIGGTEVVDANQNTIMQRRMKEALANYRPEPNPIPQIPRQEVFEPSRNPTVEQTAEQGSIDFGPEQVDMFSRQAPEPIRTRGDLQPVEQQVPQNVEYPEGPSSRPRNIKLQELLDAELAKGEGANQARVDRLRGALAEQPTAPELGKVEQAIQAKAAEKTLSEAKGEDVSFLQPTVDSEGNLNSPFYTPDSVPAAWSQRMQDGTLSFREVLDDVASGKNGNFHPEVVNYAKHIRNMAEKLGGDDVLFTRYSDDDASHSAYLANKALMGQSAPGAYYSQSEHLVRMNPEQQSLHAYLHEGTHAVTARAITAGIKGNLTGDAIKAFDRLKTLYSEIRPYVLERASADRNKRQVQTYGVSAKAHEAPALHEFVTELFTNPGFRNHLKSIKMDEIADKASSGTVRARIGAVRNAYQAVVGAIRDMLGLSKNADTVLDAAISSSHDFFTKYDVRDGRQINDNLHLNAPARNAEPELATPRGKTYARVRDMLWAKGNRPLVKEYGEYVGNQSSGTNYMTGTLTNLAEAEMPKLKGSEHLVSEAISNPANRATALSEIRQKSPQLADRLEQEIKARESNSEKLASLLEGLPDSTEGQINEAAMARKYKDSYLTKSYGINHIPDYAERFKANVEANQPAATKIWNDAKEFIRAKWMPDIVELADKNRYELGQLYKEHVGKEPPKGASTADMRMRIADAIDDIKNPEQWVENAANAVLENNKAHVVGAYYNRVGHSNAIGKELTNMPSEIAALRGEIKDPISRLALTRQNQERQIADLQGQKQLRERGIEEGLFTTRPDTASHTHKIDDNNMGYLKGLYTTPDTYASLKAVKSVDDVANGLYNALGTLTRINKAATIVGNPGNIPVNLVGSVLQTLSNGNVNMKSYARGMSASMKLIASGIRKKADPDVEFLLRNGFAEYTQTSELQHHSNGLQIAKMLEQASKKENPLQWLRENSREAFQVYNDIYGNADLWSKYANVFAERDFWAKQHPEWSSEKLDSFVKRRIDNTNITPSNVSPVFKVLDKTGVGFVTRYFANVFKNVGYNAAYGAKDFWDGATSNNTALAIHGLKRLAGNTAAAAAIPLIADKLMGPDEDRQNYLDKSDINAGSSHAILKDENGKEFTLDIDRPNPYGPAAQPILRLIKAYQEYSSDDSNKAKEHMKIALADVIGLVSNNSVFNKLGKVLWGSDSRFSKDAPEFYEGAQEAIPVSVTNLNRILNASEIVMPKAVQNFLTGRETDASLPMKIAVGSGVGVRKFDVGEDIQRYLGRGLNKDVTAARKDYMDEMKSTASVNPERIDNAFKEGMKKLVAPYEKMEAAVKAAKAQGLSDREVGIRLANSSINKQVMAMLLAGKPVPIAMMLGDVPKTITDQIKAESNPKQRQKLIDQAPAKMQALKAVLMKYKDVTMDDLKNRSGVMQ